MLRLKAKEFSDDPEFKASLGGYKKWKRRHSVSLRIKTEDLEQQKLTFHRSVITSRQRHGYSLSRIFNMDETPMQFELPSSRTFEFSNDFILCFFTLARLISKYTSRFSGVSMRWKKFFSKTFGYKPRPLWSPNFN